MKELYNLGFNDNDIKYILEICPSIKNLEEYEIINNIKILKNINCTTRDIHNIIISNPLYLDRIPSDIISLIKKLQELSIPNLNLLFDSNPFLLNKNAYEIDEYIKSGMKLGKTIEDIVEEMEYNPYIIDEI